MEIDHFVRAVREPEKKTTITLCGGGTPKYGELKLGAFVELLDVINRTNFYLFTINSFRTSGGKNEDLPLKGKWLLQHCLALPRWHAIKETSLIVSLGTDLCTVLTMIALTPLVFTL
jgi:hypothetical protein